MLLIFKGRIFCPLSYILSNILLTNKTIDFKLILPSGIFTIEDIHIPVVINNYLTTIDLLCASKGNNVSTY
jgi:hypothetical protein